MKKGIFVSTWDGGTDVITKAELDERTGEVIADTADVDGLDILEEEKFIDEDLREYEICSACHTYIKKTIMVPGIGKTLNEIQVCSDFYCENGESALYD